MCWKKLSTKLAAPIEADMEMLRHVGKVSERNAGSSIDSQEKLSGKEFQRDEKPRH